MNDNIEMQILEIINEVLEFEPGTISTESTFDEVEIDSIIFIRLVVVCETKLNMAFEDEMLLLSKFPDVNTFVDYVKSRCLSEE